MGVRELTGRGFERAGEPCVHRQPERGRSGVGDERREVVGLALHRIGTVRHRSPRPPQHDGAPQHTPQTLRIGLHERPQRLQVQRLGGETHSGELNLHLLAQRERTLHEDGGGGDVSRFGGEAGREVDVQLPAARRDAGGGQGAADLARVREVRAEAERANRLDPDRVQYLAAATTLSDVLVPGFASLVHGASGIPACT